MLVVVLIDAALVFGLSAIFDMLSGDRHMARIRALLCASLVAAAGLLYVVVAR